MVINSKQSDAELLQAIYSAAREYSNLIGNSYLIIGKNRNSDFFWFQCKFEKKHFMHLLGIDSRTLKATEFLMEAYLDDDREAYYAVIKRMDAVLEEQYNK